MKKRTKLFVVLLFCIFLSLGLFYPRFSCASENKNQHEPQKQTISQHRHAYCPDFQNYHKSDIENTEEPEPYWWQRWKNAQWTSDTQMTLTNASKSESLRSIEEVRSSIYHESIYNISTPIDSSAMRGPHGGTPGQPADWLNPALPKFPNFEGHWFPKISHSKLYFQCDLIHGDNRLDIVINRDQDTYSRYFYIYVNGQRIHSSIIGSSGFNESITYNAPITALYNIEFEIYYGGYKEHGWKLLFFWPYSGETDFSRNIPGEFFPKMSTATLQYWVECGNTTTLNLEIQRINDSYDRLFSVYLDGNIVVDEFVIGAGSHALEFVIGNYTDPPPIGVPIGDPTMHELKLQIRFGGFCEYGWQVSLCAVHYENVYVEVDWMNPVFGCLGHRPSESVVEYLEAYYKIHGYERVDFQISDTGIPHDAVTSITEFYQDIMPTYFNHSELANWRYALFGHKAEIGGGFAYGKGAFLGDLAYLVLGERWRRYILMHEFGHTVGILVWENQTEIYCANPYCVMSISPQGIQMYPWYCGFHWSLRDDPLWSLY